ncbi:MAG: hypothetical protein R3Y26_05275 [Rikenellaceae bacterium]
MIIEDIEEAVLQRMDEVGADNSSMNYPMAEMIKEATHELLRLAPLNYFMPSDFSDAKLIANRDGTGRVVLPRDFIRLISFRMDGWHRPMTVLLNASDDSYKKQFHPLTRGGVVKPAIYRRNNELLYFSLPPDSKHELVEALYLKNISALDDEFPKELQGALVWLVAAKCLSVACDTDQSNVCYENYKNLITQL